MILVTGGLGFIGTHVTRALLDLGESCVVPWRRSAERAKLLGAGQGELVLERLDVLDGEALLDLGKRYPITGVTHLAGVGLGAVPTLDALSGNVQALVNVLRAADAWGVSRVGVASTIGVYGGVAGNPLHEDMPLPAESPHMIPAAKKAMEILALRAAADAGYDVVNLRIGAIWGPLGRNDSPFFPIPRMVHAAVAGEDPGFPPDRVPYAEAGIDAATSRTAHGRSPSCRPPRPCGTTRTTWATGTRPPTGRSPPRSGRSSRTRVPAWPRVGRATRSTWTRPGYGRTPASGRPTTPGARSATTSAGCGPATRAESRSPRRTAGEARSLSGRRPGRGPA